MSYTTNSGNEGRQGIIFFCCCPSPSRRKHHFFRQRAQALIRSSPHPTYIFDDLFALSYCTVRLLHFTTYTEKRDNFQVSHVHQSHFCITLDISSALRWGTKKNTQQKKQYIYDKYRISSHFPIYTKIENNIKNKTKHQPIKKKELNDPVSHKQIN